MHFSNHVDTKNVPPHPPPNNVGMTEQSKVYRAAQTSTLLWGGGGKEEKLIHSVLIVPRVLSPIVALTVNGQISKLTVFIILHIFFSTLAVLKIGDIQSQHI